MRPSLKKQNKQAKKNSNWSNHSNNKNTTGPEAFPRASKAADPKCGLKPALPVSRKEMVTESKLMLLDSSLNPAVG